MKACWIPLIGRFGNQLFQYAFARACAEQNNLELHTPRWIGEKIFQIEPTPEKQPDDLVIGGYRQNQSSLLYTRKQVREWFTFRPEIEEKLSDFVPGRGEIVGHRRVGDYIGYGYPVVSKKSYVEAVKKYGIDFYGQVLITFISEEAPIRSRYFQSLGMEFLPDFYFMLKASVLFRANSSFSYWAAVLADNSQQVLSPVIDGLNGGQEHDCEFVIGNSPKLSETTDCTDLNLEEE